MALLPRGLPYGETDQVLHAGDALVLCSDGVTDAQDVAGEEFGDMRLLDVPRTSTGQSARAIVDHIFKAIDTFVGGSPQFDDMTVLVASRLTADGTRVAPTA